MSAELKVRCGKGKEISKDFKDLKDGRKDFKEPKERKDAKEGKEGKEIVKDFKDMKDGRKDFKEPKEGKEFGKDFNKEFEKPGDKPFEKRPEKPEIDKGIQEEKPPIAEGPGGGFDFNFGHNFSGATDADQSGLDQRVAALEARLYGEGPFIGQDLRPDLSMSQYSGEPDRQGQEPIANKRAFDNKPPEATPDAGPQY